MPTLTITLEETYWNKGFFNIPRDFERFITTEDGSIDIYLGDAPNSISGRVRRAANRNATPRIYGNKPLVEYFRSSCRRGGGLQVHIVSPKVLRLLPTS